MIDPTNDNVHMKDHNSMMSYNHFYHSLYNCGLSHSHQHDRDQDNTMFGKDFSWGRMNGIRCKCHRANCELIDVTLLI